MIETQGIPQLATAAAVALGAITAASARLPRLAILGLLVALLGGPLITHAVPDPLGVAPRLIASVLGGYLLWIAVRDAPGGTFRGAALGWAGVAAVGGAAFAAGVGIALGLVGEAGTGEALGAGSTTSLVEGTTTGMLRAADPAAAIGGLGAAMSLAVVAAAPALFGRDALRTGLGLLLLVAAVDLLREALAAVYARPVDVAAERGIELAFAVATVATAAAAAWLTRRVLAERGDLELSARRLGRVSLAEGRGGRP